MMLKKDNVNFVGADEKDATVEAIHILIDHRADILVFRCERKNES